jgi:hypothetical protein
MDAFKASADKLPLLAKALKKARIDCDNQYGMIRHYRKIIHCDENGSSEKLGKATTILIVLSAQVTRHKAILQEHQAKHIKLACAVLGPSLRECLKALDHRKEHCSPGLCERVWDD